MNITLKSSRYSSDKLSNSLLAIMEETRLCSMATVDPHDESYINTAFFCFDENLNIYFVSDWKTKHCKNFSKRPSVAITIFDSHQKWGESLRGIQLFGECFATEIDEARKAEKLYGARFRGYAEYRKSISERERQQSQHRFFVFRAKTVKIFDEDNLGEENFVRAIIVKDRNA
jgi:uncharacterized protein YhbP (UPF0306 family)